MGRRARPKPGFDRELSDLPAPLRWREYMMRVEAVIFAASQPVTRETLAAVIGSDCILDLLIADIRAELKSRPYELNAHRSQIFVKQDQSRVRRQRFVARRQFERQNRL
jgi:chromosome segregation and condensation protein ScpB